MTTASDLFYLHEFQQSLSLSQGTHPEIEFLSHVALNNLTPIKGLQHSDHPAMKSIALFAVFQHASTQRPVALQKLGELAMTGDEISAYLYICALTHKTDNPENTKQAFIHSVSFLTGAPSSLLLALRRQLLLSLGPDGAAAASEAAALSEQTTLHHIQNILLDIASGAYDDAYYGVSDLVLQFEHADLNVTGSAVLALAKIAANIGRGRPGDVAENLREQNPNLVAVEGAMVTSVGAAFRAGEGDKAMKELRVLGEKFPDNELTLAWRTCREACAGFRA